MPKTIIFHWHYIHRSSLSFRMQINLCTKLQWIQPIKIKLNYNDRKKAEILRIWTKLNMSKTILWRICASMTRIEKNLIKHCQGIYRKIVCLCFHARFISIQDLYDRIEGIITALSYENIEWNAALRTKKLILHLLKRVYEIEFYWTDRPINGNNGMLLPK